MRSAVAPAIGATVMNIPVHGSSFKPASQRTAAHHDLEQLGVEEDAGEQRPECAEDRRVAGGEGA